MSISSFLKILFLELQSRLNKKSLFVVDLFLVGYCGPMQQVTNRKKGRSVSFYTYSLGKQPNQALFFGQNFLMDQWYHLEEQCRFNFNLLVY